MWSTGALHFVCEQVVMYEYIRRCADVLQPHTRFRVGWSVEAPRALIAADVTFQRLTCALAHYFDDHARMLSEMRAAFAATDWGTILRTLLALETTDCYMLQNEALSLAEWLSNEAVESREFFKEQVRLILTCLE